MQERPGRHPDIIAFLCTRVKSPGLHDWKKLLRLLRYLKKTKSLVTTLGADDTNIVRWYADAAFAFHPDMRSHSGGVMTMGLGGITSISSKQKLNTKSSTEAELVGADDVLGPLLWAKYFLEEQNYDCKGTVLYQDNQSAILLEKNGRESSSKRTRHINIRYYFIKDNIKRKELTVEYCPTDDMLADFFTKPLQGEKFRKFRRRIMHLDRD